MRKIKRVLLEVITKPCNFTYIITLFIIKAFYKKNKHSILCCDLWKEETVAFVCFQRVITTCFFKKYAHRDFTFVRNEKN